MDRDRHLAILALFRDQSDLKRTAKFDKAIELHVPASAVLRRSARQLTCKLSADFRKMRRVHMIARAAEIGIAWRKPVFPGDKAWRRRYIAIDDRPEHAHTLIAERNRIFPDIGELYRGCIVRDRLFLLLAPSFEIAVLEDDTGAGHPIDERTIAIEQRQPIANRSIFAVRFGYPVRGMTDARLATCPFGLGEGGPFGRIQRPARRTGAACDPEIDRLDDNRIMRIECEPRPFLLIIGTAEDYAAIVQYVIGMGELFDIGDGHSG